MSFETVEVSNTVAQTHRIHQALVAAGFPSELVSNPLGDALAVLVPDLINPDDIPLKPEIEPAVDRAVNDEPRNNITQVLPTAGLRVYPKVFLDVVDLAVQSAAERTDILPFPFSSPTRRDHNSKMSQGTKILPVHADFIGHSANYEPGRPLYGLNFHFTRQGSYHVKMGLLRRLEDELSLQEIEMRPPLEMTSTQVTQSVERMYDAYAAPFTELDVSAGGLLIFQARVHKARKLVPVAHEFTTTSVAGRLSDIYTPKAANIDDVLGYRQAILKEYDFSDLGYEAA
jgi:hypothetical protein